MSEAKQSLTNLVSQLKERTKELNCLYSIEEIIHNPNLSLDQKLIDILDVVPQGWQYPDICSVRIKYLDSVYQSKDFYESKWTISIDLIVQEKKVGEFAVAYSQEVTPLRDGAFLPEEEKLLHNIADRLSHFLLYENLKTVFHDLQQVKERITKSSQGEWRIVIDMLRRTDPSLFMSILRKLLHQLCWKGIEEAELLMRQSSIDLTTGETGSSTQDENRPLKKKLINNYDEYIEAILGLANEYLYDDEIMMKVQKWIQEDKSKELVKALETAGTSLSEIADAIRKFYHMAPEKVQLSPSTIKGLRVSLLRKFFTDELNYIKIAKEFVKLTDFYNLIHKMIYMPMSHGKLGGKSSGVFLASNILKKMSEGAEIPFKIKVPKTWYLTSDCVLAFVKHNNLEEVLEQKYKELDEIRMEYPHIVQVFKNSQFPPDIVKGLSMALDDLGENPIVVRSSSLLEDQLGAAFSGKYKSLFLANQGTKQQRLNELMDAIAEVYASTFGPDPIEYRAERGLLDFHEEMGIMIMEVVGTKIGHYYLPSFAGVAFSHNEFRWSPRIKREDGLVRIVPGLGTRAVDRTSDDYPLLIAPGQPDLRVNVSTDDMERYSPKRIDVINLKTNEFQTIKIKNLLRRFGHEYPNLDKLISVFKDGMLRPMAWDTDFEQDDIIVSFEGLIKRTKLIKQIDIILKTLQERFKSPVDIEFASDGTDFYLLQCRPQSSTRQAVGDVIPKTIEAEKTIFTANKFVSNGKVPDVSHIVYVDPLKYGTLKTREEMLDVGRAVGRLNKMLPRRKFILMGPGRWGSRGDIKLGVSVTYSEINNTSMLIEIAKKTGNYLPDLSFGTHFFQDLVEASIRYLPLYPDEEETVFNYEFLENAKNLLPVMLPDFAHIQDTLKVIDIPSITNGLIVKVLMNAEIDKAVGILKKPSDTLETESDEEVFALPESGPRQHWKWRHKMAENIAAQIDPKRFGVKGIYLFGSTKNAVAGPDSDINLIIHVDDKDSMREHIRDLNNWLEGWSLALSTLNYLRTGIQIENFLDVNFVTDNDIERKQGHARRINAPTNAARPLQLKKMKIY